MSVILGVMDWRLTLSILVAICTVFSIWTELSKFGMNYQSHLDSDEV